MPRQSVPPDHEAYDRRSRGRARAGHGRADQSEHADSLRRQGGLDRDDGDDKNSPFTTALLKHLPKPGLDLRRAFGFVRDDVLKVTHNRQEPFIYGSLGGDDVALVPAPPVVDFNKAAKDDYELAQQINVISAWDSFIGKYPSGFYSDLARAQRDKLIAAKAAAEEADRLAAQKKALEEAKAAEGERAKLAAQAKAAEDARILAEQAAAAEKAKAAEKAAEKAAAQARIEEAARVAGVLPDRKRWHRQGDEE